MMQGSAADCINARLNDSYTNPSFDELKDSFEEHYFKAKELKREEASALWLEKQLPDEKVLDYVIRVKKLARQLEFPSDMIQIVVRQGFRSRI